MIDIKDLMFGDLVKVTRYWSDDDDDHMQSRTEVKQLDWGDIECAHFYPDSISFDLVPMTSDVLIKNGFTKVEGEKLGRDCKFVYFYKKGILRNGRCANRLIELEEFGDGSWNMDVHVFGLMGYATRRSTKTEVFLSVHELQHALKECIAEMELTF